MAAGAPGRPGRFHGFLVIDKPAGWTSHDVVGRVRRLLGERQVGHAGTLDPAATGVLPVAVGAATRVVEYLTDASKTYAAEVTFGVRTDSHDVDGRVVGLDDATGLARDDVAGALAGFAGEQLQVPPMHSAVKVGGRRLYDLARRGEEVERQPRPVVFHELRLTAWEPPVASVVVDCSKGTYVRSLARDLGEVLGVGAHLSELVRMRAGPFSLCEAWTLTELAELDLGVVWPDVAIHPDVAVADWPALVLAASAAEAWEQGKLVAGSARVERCRVYDDGGAWLGGGLGDPVAGGWRPTKVVRRSA